VEIQICASRIQGSNTCIEVTTHVTDTWLGLGISLFISMMEGSGMYTVDGISLAVPSAAPSHLGADSTTVNFKGERSVVRLAETVTFECSRCEYQCIYLLYLTFAE
jgi:hypothetical protein